MYRDERIIGVERKLSYYAYSIVNTLLLLAICYRMFILKIQLSDYLDIVMIYSFSVLFMFTASIKEGIMLSKEKKFNIRKILLRELIVLALYFMVFLGLLGMSFNYELIVTLILLYGVRVSLVSFKEYRSFKSESKSL